MARVDSIKEIKKLYKDLWGVHSPETLFTYEGSEYPFFQPGNMGYLFPGILNDYILSRDEYKKAYAHILNAHREILGTTRLLGYVLTGQPGIGKSTFLAYVLKERLQRKLPTAVELPQGDSQYVLFSSNGVKFYHGGVMPHEGGNARLLDVWALSNSDSTTGVPCHAFLHSRAVLIQATSPAEHRWKRWKKVRSARLYVMDVWVLGEVGAVLNKLGFDTTRGQQLMSKYGPCARTIIEIVRDPLLETTHVQAIQDAAKHVAQNVPAVLIALARLNIPAGDAPSCLFCVRPKSQDSRAEWQAYIPTSHLANELADALAMKATADQQVLFSNLSVHPASRTAAGHLFENLMHARLTKVGGNPIVCVDTTGGRHTIEIPESSCFIVGTLSKLKNSDPPFYWRPGATNFPGIDSVLGTPDSLWAFQATIGRTHVTADAGLELLASHLGRKVVTRIRLVVVSPLLEDARLIAHSMQKNWGNVSVYACQLDVGISALSATRSMDLSSSEVEAEDEPTGGERPLASLSSRDEGTKADVELTLSTKRKAPAPAVTTRSTRRKIEDSSSNRNEDIRSRSNRTLRRKK
ncbi:hypothetical protein BC835DRAFT_1424427 [Cytidiella melzeri]|nr:hypothetical protein BC835DRAFT_1424427 [Cytidiella melzeri]